MNKARAVLDALLKEGGLTTGVIAKRAGMEPRDAGRALSRLVAQGRASQSKVLGSYTRYSLTDAQKLRHQLGSRGVPDDFAGQTLHVFAIDAAVRLRFLDELKTRPAFAGCAVLAAIADDYRRTLAALTKEKR